MSLTYYLYFSKNEILQPLNIFWAWVVHITYPSMNWSNSVAKFSARNYRTKGQKLSFLDQNYRILYFYAIFHKLKKFNMAKKMVCPVQIIVFHPFRPKIIVQYYYRIIVHLATLYHDFLSGYGLREDFLPCTDLS